jgi:polar amino acid transport system substrate-binding protein
MPRWLSYAAGLVAVGCLAVIISFFWPKRGGPSLEASTFWPTYDRVIRSGELRVGYLILPPVLSKNTASGQLSGISYDFTEEMGRRLGLKVRWIEEVSLATLSTGLDSGRLDMIAFPLWRSAARAKNVAFSVPLYYTTVGIYVREDDNRFDSDVLLINSPDVRISGMDGELAADIARTDFPKAKLDLLPQFSDYSQMLLEIATRKADVTFFDRVFGKRFMRQNPGKIKDVSGDNPIRVFAECLILPLGDTKFLSMINASVAELVENGNLDRIFEQNGEDPREYYRVAIPYRKPSL